MTVADTNDTFEARLCVDIGSTTTSVAITGISSNLLRLPSCIGENSPILSSFAATYVIVDDFSVLPNTLTTINLQYCKFPNASSYAENPASATPEPSPTPTVDALDGFDTYGNISWTEMWSLFPIADSVTIWSSGLYGNLPEVLPARMVRLALYYNRLTGTLPSGLFSQTGGYGSSLINVQVMQNQISGTIPENWFSSYESKSLTTQFYIDFRSNALTGSIPPALLQPLASADTKAFILSFEDNKLTGTLSNAFFPSGLLASTASFALSFGGNSLEGIYPSNFLTNLTFSDSFSLTLSKNRFSGPLPENLFASPWMRYGIAINLFMANNNFSGTIPSGLISSYLLENSTVSSFQLDLSHNQLEGPLPETLLFRRTGSKREATEAIDSGLQNRASSSGFEALDTSVVAWTATNFGIKLNYNQLNGTIPESLLYHFFPSSATSGILFLDNNNFTGPFPLGFFAPANQSTGSVSLSLSNNSLSGPLPEYCWTGMSIGMQLANSGLSGTIPSSWGSACSTMGSLTLTGSADITGPIPPTLFSTVAQLWADNTSLNGTLPVPGSSLAFLSLSYTKVDFCASTAFSSAFTRFGFFYYTSACNCTSAYTKSTIFLACPPDTSCPSGTQPSSDFVCQNGRWTAAAVNATTLVIPSGAGNIVVTGNLTSTTIRLGDITSSINVTGCATNLTNIDVDLSAAQAENLGNSKQLQTLIAQSGSDGYGAGCQSLSSVNINSKVSGKTCKKLKSQKETSNGGTTLSSYWSLSTSSCNTWWIILASVLCGVALLVVIIIIVIYVVCPKAKLHFRPFASSESRLRPL